MSQELLLYAVLQGVTEQFPISSLGHGVLVSTLLGWGLNRQGPGFLPFLVVLHLGTASALGLFFWRDWKALLANTWRARGRPDNPEAKLFWLLMIASIPAGLLGLLLEKQLRHLFGSFLVVAFFLIVNGGVLLLVDRLKHRRSIPDLSELRWGKAFIIGLAQALALIPGFSRSGLTLVAGLGVGLDYAASARFSFLMATPIIGAAGILEVPKLFHADVHMNIGLVLLSGLLAGGFAYLSTWILMRYFKDHEAKALRPFAYYCIVFGLGAFAELLSKLVYGPLNQAAA